MSRTITRLFVCAATLSAALALSPTATSHSTIGSDEGGNLATLVESSNLVFIGRVVRVDYRRGETKEGAALPFAFVTYEVADVLRGSAPGKSITLRFVGGSDGRGGFVEVNGVPMFQPKEHDLLFVVGNGEAGCPLVMCEWGRYRIYEHGVYNTHGSPVRALVKGEAIARGAPPGAFAAFRYPAPTFDELLKNPQVQAQAKQMGVAAESLRARYAAEAPKEIVLSRSIVPPARESGQDLLKTEGAAVDPGKSAASAMLPDGIPEGPVAVEMFVQTLKTLISQSKRKPGAIRSVDVRAPIRISIAKESGPSQPPTAARELAYAGSAEDSAELEALRKQDFNPVIPRK